MQEAVIDTKNIHPLTDFLRNYKVHIANLKATKAPEVLTVNGRAEVVVIDAESYENLMRKIRHMQSVSEVRQIISRSKHEEKPVTEEEIERSRSVMMELVAETERLGLYK